jgi:hypothetical protein
MMRSTLGKFQGDRMNRLGAQLHCEDVGGKEFVMLPMFLCWLSRWILVSFSHTKNRRRNRSTLDTLSIRCHGHSPINKTSRNIDSRLQRLTWLDSAQLGEYNIGVYLIVNCTNEQNISSKQIRRE